MSECCPTCGQSVPKPRVRFTAAEKAAIAHQYLRLGMKQVHLARIHGCRQGTISKFVRDHAA